MRAFRLQTEEIVYDSHTTYKTLDKIILMPNSTLNQEDSDLRFKGNNSGIGRIVKGTLHEAPIKIKVSSIPSKHENIVYRSNSQHAFGDSTRKDYDPARIRDSLNPGPGLYDGEAKFEKVSSKKGSGSFASSTPNNRFNKARSHIPGPGSYQVSKKLGKPMKRSSSSHVSTTQSTVQLSTKIQSQAHNLFQRQIQESKKAPGPGFYELNQSGRLNRIMSLGSTFRSKVQRFSDNDNGNPAVGCYQISKKTGQITITKKMDNQQKKYPLETDQERKKKLEAILSSGKTSDKNDFDKIGPGAYNPQLLATKTKGFKIQQSLHDRFGQLKPIYAMAKTINFEGTGGMYTMDEEPNHRTSGAGLTSMFKSTTKRSDLILSGKMDPWKYKADKSPAKKSHLLNFTQKWV